MALIRLNVNLNQETADALKRLASTQAVSLTEMIRRCIAITTFILDEKAAGNRIIVERRDGTHRKEMVMM